MGLDRSSGGARFGAYLRSLRERRKLTLEAAENLSASMETRLTSSYMSRLESGLTIPNLARLSAISRIYDVPLTTLVEKFDLEHGHGSVAPSDIPDGLSAMDALLRRKLGAGAYLEALQLAAEAEKQIETDGEKADRWGPAGLRFLRIVKCQAMLHLELYESAKFEAERLLELEDLTAQHRLIAWQFFIGCCTRLRRYNLALTALEQAERESRSPDSPARTTADLKVLRGDLLIKTGRLEAAAEEFAAAVKCYKENGNLAETCRAQMNLGSALLEMNRLAAARSYLLRSVEEAERGGWDQIRACALANLAAVAWRSGDPARSEQYAYRAEALGKQLELPAVRFKSTYYLMRAAEAAEDTRAAQGYRQLLISQANKTLPPSPELDHVRAMSSRRNGDTP